MESKEALTKRELMRQFEHEGNPGVFLVKKWRKTRWRVTIEELPQTEEHGKRE